MRVASVFQHLEAPATCARVLTVDYSFALPAGAQKALCQLDIVPETMQAVEVHNNSKSMVIYTGAHRGVLPLQLYSLYTNDCIALVTLTLLYCVDF